MSVCVRIKKDIYNLDVFFLSWKSILLPAYELKLLTMSRWSRGLFPPPSQHSPAYHHLRRTHRRPPADTGKAGAFWLRSGLNIHQFLERIHQTWMSKVRAGTEHSKRHSQAGNVAYHFFSSFFKIKHNIFMQKLNILSTNILTQNGMNWCTEFSCSSTLKP